MRIALDTNLLVYAEGYGDDVRCEQARSLIEAVPAISVVIPGQCLGELFRVLHAKAGLPRGLAADRVLRWADVFTIADSGSQAFLLALDLVRSHLLQIWDALIISVANTSQCRLLATEDSPGQPMLAGVTTANPFTDEGYERVLATALR